jgi:hypothetical protein
VIYAGRLVLLRWDGYVARKGSEERSAQGILAEDLPVKQLYPRPGKRWGMLLRGN